MGNENTNKLKCERDFFYLSICERDILFDYINIDNY